MNKYDTPILLKERENLLDDQKSKNNILIWLLVGGVIILGFLLIIIFRARKKIKLYKQNALVLVQTPQTREKNLDLSTPRIDTLEYISDKPKSKNKTVISNDNLKKISSQLDEFESTKHFLYNKVNLDSLSKDFKTNRAYLSKSINELKGQSFPQYLNELRIQYIIKELIENKNLRKLTIAAIAEEAGFNNAESFTKAFKKITGTLPSYYIKIIQENNK
ncbi:helix-turn-helix transcriptional regulator [Elizabethkingia anophelis]|nr:helix-turn-helix transcriptional regulator [Elizabethkingia anophelis]MCT3823650.1 helix-turn-helix transcriptional regulator [Elizabethkingia anophelis]MCT3931205.1 helix-turn-helix transcriptional regulator [Elizabethkingia anophelis]MCT4077911.1 helix-turn-helix transcriptional regulator [Elizabethkingia anophelis]MCT4081592.1 helix-turn-helix transcriptional regulator [Elizabethkingia anophelis]